MLAFLKLIRLPNLLIIAFTMYTVRYCLILPVVRQADLSLGMPDLYFFLITLSTVMVAAAGYIINDYFDRKMDVINKPDEVVVDKGIKCRVAMGAHVVITTFAVIIGISVSYLSDLFFVGTMIFIFCTASLWFYSTTFKRQFLIGNIIISLLAALVPAVAALFEMTFTAKMAHEVLPEEVVSIMNEAILTILSGYAFFAFVISLIREIIKDIEDYDGDDAFGCKTLPIVLGKRTAKYCSAALALTVLGLISYLSFDYISFVSQIPAADPGIASQGMGPVYYVAAFVQLPLLALILLLVFAREKKHFRLASFLTKTIMLTGICFLFIFRYETENNFWMIF